MGRKKNIEKDEPFISRDQLAKKRGLKKKFIKEKLGPVMYDFGHRTKCYKLSEVDIFIKQMKSA